MILQERTDIHGGVLGDRMGFGKVGPPPLTPLIYLREYSSFPHRHAPSSVTSSSVPGSTVISSACMPRGPQPTNLLTLFQWGSDRLIIHGGSDPTLVLAPVLKYGQSNVFVNTRVSPQGLDPPGELRSFSHPRTS
jgi:hypothetical protein